MKIYTRAIAIAMILLTVVFGAYVAFSDAKTATALRDGIQMSIEEDFKIKDSLGKVFFVEAQEEDSKQVSAGVTVNAFVKPIDASWQKSGEAIEFYPQKYQSVCAIAKGEVLLAQGESIKIKHSDGTISTYLSCKPLCKVGETVFSGKTIGYASEKMTLMVEKDGKKIDLSAFFE